MVWTPKTIIAFIVLILMFCIAAVGWVALFLHPYMFFSPMFARAVLLSIPFLLFRKVRSIFRAKKIK